jgi:tetratricopeptide (TPR) repeat protein
MRTERRTNTTKLIIAICNFSKYITFFKYNKLFEIYQIYQIFRNISNFTKYIKCYENSSGRSRLIPCGRKERQAVKHDEANNCFLQFFEIYHIFRNISNYSKYIRYIKFFEIHQIYQIFRNIKNFSKYIKYIKCHENLPSPSRLIPCGRKERQTVKHDEANNCFLQFFEIYQIFQNISDFMKICPVEAALFNADGKKTGRQTRRS